VEHLRYSAIIDSVKKEESRVFPYWLIVLLFLLVLGCLIYLFPGKTLLNTLVNQEYISDADFRYSLLLVKASGDNTINYSNIEKSPTIAINALSVISPHESPELIWLKYIILKNILFKHQSNKEVKLKAIAAINQYLIYFRNTPLSAAQYIQLAEDSLAINNSLVALSLYEKAMHKGYFTENVHFYEKIARTAVWAKQCIPSAEYYFISQGKVKSIEDKRYFFIAGLKVLFQCNQYDLAMKMAEKHIDGLRNDPLTYQLLTDLAIKANQPVKAQEFVLKLLQLRETQP
jgi:hypothetical protein